MDRILDSVGYGYRLCILGGDLNRWVGDRTKDGITGAFGVPGEDDNGKRVVEFCGNTYFKHRSFGREWRLPASLDLVLCGESEEYLKAIVGRFAEVCKRRGLKVNAGKERMD